MGDVSLPDDAVQRILAVHGRRGADWIRELPRHIADLMQEWSLVWVGEPFPGAHAGLVAPARGRDGAGCVLKIVPSAQWANHEADALAHWSGRGAAGLIAVNRELGALLMDRVSPGTSLVALCSSNDRAATAAAAHVIAQLRTAPAAAAVVLPDVTSWIGALQPSAQAVPRPLRDAADRAASVAGDLLADAGRTVLHGDLHHYNVLKTDHDTWLAIDPRGLIGLPEAEPAALLRNPRAFILSHPAPTRLLADRLAVLEERLGDDRRLLALWGYVLAVVAAAWALEDLEGEDDMRRWLACADLLRSRAALP
jgi:streptomycin 6-kinase